MTLVDPDQGLGSFGQDPSKVALVAQTTLGMYEWQGVLDEAADRYPDLRTARRSDLCYATTNRQSAIGELAERSRHDAGGRLRELIEHPGPGAGRPQGG